MKYTNHAVAMSLEERATWNETIAAAIEKGTVASIEADEIYNRYTGKGRLHGLDRKDYANYYRYSSAKKEYEQGQFFTPHNLCQQVVETLQPHTDFLVADLTCGIGNFFNWLPNEANIYGNERDETACKVCRYLYPDAHIENEDFVYYTPKEKFDVVIGNPPFNLITDGGVSQWQYVRKSYELLHFGGLLALILPDSFLKDSFQDSHKIQWLDEHFNFIVQCKIPDNSFYAVIDTKLLIVQKKGVSNSNETYKADAYTAFEPAQLYSGLIAPLWEQYKADAPKRHLLTIRQSVDDRGLQYQITKCLWHIKSNPALNKGFYKKAMEKIELLSTQKQPADVSDREWERIKLTPDKVHRYLRTILKNQNEPKPKRIIKTVKTSYGLRNKAYHKKLEHKGWHKSVHDILLNGERFAPYCRLYDRKKKQLDIQNQPFVSMQRDAAIDKYLNGFTLTPAIPAGQLFPVSDAPDIRLNDMQKHDLGLLLQKRYDILAWEQGGGKSVAGMCYMRYWQGHYTNCFLLAPALAVNTTWTERLAAYGFDFIQPETITDISRIKKGQVVLMSYDRLVTLQKHIKRFVKQSGYKIALLVDESDELTNAGSQRSRAALDCFRKAKYKLLTTGTTTRNTINEIYTQMELVYNNSTAFTCWAERVYHVNEANEIEEDINAKVGYPFPAYRGAGLFKACFCPQKSTVLGIKKDNQDIYNADILKELINKTVITRKFEEITGEKKYSIHTHSIAQADGERQLYEMLLKDFLQVCYDFYTTTGNSRKEAALRLIRQIMVLIKATSIPHLMPHYQGAGLPNKYHKIFALAEEWNKERVTIGTIFKTAANSYYTQLQQRFPYRLILHIDGEMNISARKRTLEKFKRSANAILVCTQQALKSSVNIPYCNKCIIEALQWNIPKISQFYFRFIRFDSVKHTQVHFVNYENTIELNLLALLMAKEKLNDFIKTTNVATTESVYEEFNIDMGILDLLIQKEYDKDGNLTLNWGKQQLYNY
jgi:hypothetical protein